MKLNEVPTDTIKNYIWNAVANGQPIPGCFTVDQLREELITRGEKPLGFHNT